MAIIDQCEFCGQEDVAVQELKCDLDCSHWSCEDCHLKILNGDDEE